MTIFFCHSQPGFSLAKNPEGSWPCKSFPPPRSCSYPKSSPLACHRIKPTSWWQGRRKKPGRLYSSSLTVMHEYPTRNLLLPHSIRCWTLFFHSTSDRQTVRLGPSAQVPEQLPDSSPADWLPMTHTHTPCYILSRQLLCLSYWTCASANVGGYLLMNCPIFLPSS